MLVQRGRQEAAAVAVLAAVQPGVAALAALAALAERLQALGLVPPQLVLLAPLVVAEEGFCYAFFRVLAAVCLLVGGQRVRLRSTNVASIVAPRSGQHVGSSARIGSGEQECRPQGLEPLLAEGPPVCPVPRVVLGWVPRGHLAGAPQFPAPLRGACQQQARPPPRVAESFGRPATCVDTRL